MKTNTRPNGVAPSPPGRWTLGAKGGRVAQAWQHVWDQLHRSEFRDGVALAERAATHARVRPESVRAVLHRAAAAGLLESKPGHAQVHVERYGKAFDVMQNRTFYRIAPVPVPDFSQEPQ